VKYRSVLLAAASGSVGGCCFSRSKQGPYIRRRAIGVDRNTRAQIAVRGAFAALAGQWHSVLTHDQRTTWETFARNTPLRDALGRNHRITGHNAYIRANSLRLIAGYPIIDNAPTVFAETTLTPPVLALADASSQLISLTLATTDPWNNQDDGALLTFMAPPQNASIAGYAGTYVLADVTPGVFGSPSPTTAFVSPLRINTGQRVFLRHRAFAEDSRISPPWTSTIVVTP